MVHFFEQKWSSEFEFSCKVLDYALALIKCIQIYGAGCWCDESSYHKHYYTSP